MMADSETKGGNRDGKQDRGPYKRNRRGDRSHHPKPKAEEEDSSENVELTPTLLAFKEYQSELDLKHDKHERLVKVSRDITIESKRIIFLLHRIDGDSDKVLIEAETRLKSLEDTLISKIASELKGEDLHQFIRAFSPGVQEYIEAVSFYLFIKEERLVTLDEIISRLTFSLKEDIKKVVNEEAEEAGRVKSRSEASDSTEKQDQLDPLNLKESKSGSDHGTLALKLPPLEYMLGLADFTGELMRMCINIIGSGDLERPFQLVNFMRNINRGFQQLGNIAGREMVRKSTVMRQSLKKMEDACYVIKVRGSEIPKHMLKDMAFSSDFSARDDDYGRDMMD
ncbi:translin-associated protein X [Strongylocentrotus purpuratus]|uniref:Translin-associated protein X n=1 Tax=Strongylocentrotus purpuratus TaxID=7668 RepID=A0A7M7HGR5_STRPU|nr:translin-associated protein X [Strongylocentrotus purpuratus]